MKADSKYPGMDLVPYGRFQEIRRTASPQSSRANKDEYRSDEQNLRKCDYKCRSPGIIVQGIRSTLHLCPVRRKRSLLKNSGVDVVLHIIHIYEFLSLGLGSPKATRCRPPPL